MRVLVTGSAGFVGAHICCALRGIKGFEVLGVDNFNPYYDPNLKRARVAHLTPGMRHFEIDISNHIALAELIEDISPHVVVHLAAQAGVRHSFIKPMDYVQSNLTGQVSLLEALKNTGSLRRLIYASSSSVYSGVRTLPFREDVQLGTPKSLYAATKVADEVLTDTYSHLFGIDAIGLRFFTVYGPWGRPDMAYWLFAKSILNGDTIQLFNDGDIRRDFTYIDDITSAITRMVEEVRDSELDQAQHRLYNIGNHSPEPVGNLISALEKQLGKKANVELASLPPGDMVETYADVDKLRADYEFSPQTSLEFGVSQFSKWYLNWSMGNGFGNPKVITG